MPRSSIPSLDLTWETDSDDVEYSQAMCRAYNRWVTDWWRTVAAA